MSHLKMSISSWGEIHLDPKGVRALMRGAGNDVARKTRALISRGGGGGRTYRGGGGGACRGGYKPGHYTASAPGEPPVQVTGSLRNSLKTYVYRDGLGFAVRERQFYSLFLEAGAQGGGNAGQRATAKQRAQARRHRARSAYTARVMEPRPHLDRVMEQEAKNLDARIGAAFEKGLTWRQTR
jgi:hypothetical protein